MWSHPLERGPRVRNLGETPAEVRIVDDTPPQRLIPAAEELQAAGREPVLINEVVRRALR